MSGCLLRDLHLPATIILNNKGIKTRDEQVTSDVMKKTQDAITEKLKKILACRTKVGIAGNKAI